jgi:hypothetical protein
MPHCTAGPSGTNEAQKVTYVRRGSAAKVALRPLNSFDALIVKVGLDLSPRTEDLSATSQVREIAVIKYPSASTLHF